MAKQRYATYTCSKCNETKPLSEFKARSDRALGHQSHCRACERKRQRDYYAANQERLAPEKAERAKEWYQRNAEDHKNKVIERRKSKSKSK